MIDQEMLGSANYSPATSIENTTSTTNDHELVFMKAPPTSTTATAKRSKKNIIKNDSSSRRFSDEQIKSLEALFKMENKLEPRKKLEMARELGLHPRQVAIWFQNRRARWKSKQVEQDYTTLKADYDTLSHRFESLKKEKHDLLQQLSNVCSQLKAEPYDSGSENGELNGNSSSRGGFSGALEQEMAIYSDEDYHDPGRRHNQLLHKQELEEKLNIQQVISGRETNEKVSNFDMGSLFEESCETTTCSNWWDVWPSN